MSNSTKPVTCFLSFADSRMAAALTRIEEQAKEMNIFDDIRICDESIIDESFRKKMQHLLRPNVRGFGYWCWKPYIILKTLESLPENSTLFYCDAGCHLNPAARGRLLFYYKEMEMGAFNMKAFPALSYQIDTNEKRWTKGDVFDYFNCRADRSITHTPQLAAGHIICKKNAENIRFFKKWLSVWDDKLSLVDDSPSISPNLSGFIENRHDQSIFSILYKLHGGTPLPDGETRYFGAVNKASYPIWDARDYGVDCRDKRFIARLRRYLRAKRIMSKISFERFLENHPKLKGLLSKND